MEKEKDKKDRILKISVPELEYVLSMLNENQQIIMGNQSIMVEKLMLLLKAINQLNKRSKK